MYQMFHRLFFIGTFITVLSINVFGQGDTKVQWITWEEVQLKASTENKKIFVDVYTDWCTWCKKMDAATFQKAHIAEYLNENYLSIKFNAEQRDEIIINGIVYKYVRAGRKGYHELANKITMGNLQYPTVVFLDENMDVIQPIPGFIDAERFEILMTFFAGDYHKTTPWRKYANSYIPIKQASSNNEQ